MNFGTEIAAGAAAPTGRPVTSAQASTAMILALVVDALQIPEIIATLSPIEGFDILLDFVTSVVMVRLLGFDLSLLPTVVLESIPVVDFAPVWSICVWGVIKKRKSEGRYVEV